MRMDPRVEASILYGPYSSYNFMKILSKEKGRAGGSLNSIPSVSSPWCFLEQPPNLDGLYYPCLTGRFVMDFQGLIQLM